jgi:hypothetical protein
MLHGGQFAWVRVQCVGDFDGGYSWDNPSPLLAQCAARTTAD